MMTHHLDNPLYKKKVEIIIYGKKYTKIFKWELNDIQRPSGGLTYSYYRRQGSAKPS